MKRVRTHVHACDVFYTNGNFLSSATHNLFSLAISYRIIHMPYEAMN